jgi:hypothetical protein
MFHVMVQLLILPLTACMSARSCCCCCCTLCCVHTQYIERMKIDILENLRHLAHAPGLQFKEVGVGMPFCHVRCACCCVLCSIGSYIGVTCALLAPGIPLCCADGLSAAHHPRRASYPGG